jgi:para-aminobenzoate synthetase component 1
MDNNQYKSPQHSYECLVAVGAVKTFETTEDLLSSLTSFTQANPDWIFGHFNYDLKNYIEEGLTSSHADPIRFPDCFLFVPQVVLQLTTQNLSIGPINGNARSIYQEIVDTTPGEDEVAKVEMQPKMSRDHYIDTIAKLLHHIKRGDCYEINFCHEFFANASINPVSVYNKLTTVSPNPFSAFYKLEDRYLLCSSPERYIKKTGDIIISQPIKGTVGRNKNLEIDVHNRQQLYYSSKERSENVMVVDLVRNDLSKIAIEGSVEVDELFGVYSFPNVHQMISTVSGVVRDNVNISDVLKATFPMGSMTGAPKRKVMELIEKYEQTKRGIFSGAVGYITPDNNFDFNVVIRSIMYNEAQNYLSYQVGSAITFNSDPDKEYEECLLKAKAIQQVLS